uniref:Uncharacterized protein n=1 Tax=Timema shepardi TaxID=629360 RepID=A0A7R9AL01_TIMSH|nr:unnamed protein product [Timema shepardi]
MNDLSTIRPRQCEASLLRVAAGLLSGLHPMKVGVWFVVSITIKFTKFPPARELEGSHDLYPRSYAPIQQLLVVSHLHLQSRDPVGLFGSLFPQDIHSGRVLYRVTLVLDWTDKDGEIGVVSCPVLTSLSGRTRGERGGCNASSQQEPVGNPLQWPDGLRRHSRVRPADDQEIGNQISVVSTESIYSSHQALPTLVKLNATSLEKGADTVNRDGEPLKFGQNFLLSPVETTTEKCLCGESTWEAQLLNGALPLYVQSEIPQIDTQLGPSGHASVRLSSVLNTYCRWRVLYWDPNMRLETEGCPFPPHCRVIVNHSSSNKNLSVEPCHWFPSYFGMECQVSVHTYRDVHRRETSENMWMFITQKPTDPQVVKPSD